MKHSFISLLLTGSLLVACDGTDNEITPTPGPESPGEKEISATPVEIDLSDAEKSVVADCNVFALNLLSVVNEAKTAESDNILLSPLSLSQFLSMLANGVTGDSYKEIVETMGLQAYSPEALNDYNRKMIAGLKKADEGVVLASANSIWSNKQIALKENFVETGKAFYQAECHSVDFDDPSTVANMNQWCSEQTNGKITKILDQTNGSDLLYMVNALYFSAKWKDEFDKENTKEGTFVQSNGKQQTVSYMNREVNENYFANELFATTTIMYGNRAYYMQLILPAGDVSVRQVLDKLKEPGYWAACKQKEKIHTVRLSLPRFKIDDNEIDVKDFLEKLGIKKIFKSSTDFSLMTDVNAAISMIKQKTYLSVDEKGSEAAAVTYGGWITSPGTPIPVAPAFVANKPFLFTICESSTDAILFMGEVNSL
ncbi:MULTISPECIES: serpin family protein [Parabacteroides]|uniref:serpin family protein n=1 Tax=Parabacteroides provencensis TaxID=1944636 RepID=UPI000C1548FF|nr:serpin family protein [Parabacteroides provencensis]